MTAGAVATLPFERRRRWPLALIVGVHGLALLLALQARHAPPLPHPAASTEGILFLLPARQDTAAARPRTPPAPAEARSTAAAPIHPDAHRAPASTPAAPSLAPAAAAPMQSEAAAPAMPAATPAATPPASATADSAPASLPSDADIDPAAAARSAGSAAANHGSFALGLAKRQAGRIDHELRKGKSGVPVEADTPWARFQRGIEAAHIDRSLAVIEDSYTSPDGVIYYRFRQGNQVRCRRSGGLNTLLQGMPQAGAAMNVDCPKGVEWKSDAP